MMGAGRRARKRPSHLGVLPLTSLIDVVFLLLVYFLVTSSFTEPERDLSSVVQMDGGGVRVSELVPQVVEIGRGVGGRVEFRIGGHVTVTQSGLREILESLPKEAGVAIRAGSDVPISAVAAAMQASQDAGFIKRSYVPTDE